MLVPRRNILIEGYSARIVSVTVNAVLVRLIVGTEYPYTDMYVPMPVNHVVSSSLLCIVQDELLLLK